MTDISADLRQAVEVLSRPADEQLEYLSGISKAAGLRGLGVDELALEFDDAFRPSIQSIAGSARELLVALDSRLNRMSGPANGMLWTEDALRGREEWNEVRRLAKSCLEAFQQIDSP